MAAPPSQAVQADAVLRACVLDYLEKHGFRDSAATMRSEVESNPNFSPANVPVDLPAAFLHEWFRFFWELWIHAAGDIQKDQYRASPRNSVALSSVAQMTSAGILQSMLLTGSRSNTSMDAPQPFSAPPGPAGSRVMSASMASQPMSVGLQPVSVGPQLPFNQGQMNLNGQNVQPGVGFGDSSNSNLPRRDGNTSNATNHPPSSMNAVFANRSISNATPPPHPHLHEGLTRHSLQQQALQGPAQGHHLPQNAPQTQDQPHRHPQMQHSSQQQQQQQLQKQDQQQEQQQLQEQQQVLKFGKPDIIGQQGRGNASSDNSSVQFQRNDGGRSSGKFSNQSGTDDVSMFDHVGSNAMATSSRKRVGSSASLSVALVGSNPQGMALTTKQHDGGLAAKRQRTEPMNVANPGLNGIRVPPHTLTNLSPDMTGNDAQSGALQMSKQQVQHGLRQNKMLRQHQQNLPGAMESPSPPEGVSGRNQQHHLQHELHFQGHPSHQNLHLHGQQLLHQQSQLQQQQQQQQHHMQQMQQVHLRQQQRQQSHQAIQQPAQMQPTVQVQQQSYLQARTQHQQLHQQQELHQQQPRAQHPQSQPHSQTSMQPVQQNPQHQLLQQMPSMEQQQPTHVSPSQQSAAQQLHHHQSQGSHSLFVQRQQQQGKLVRQTQAALQKSSLHGNARVQQQNHVPSPAPQQLQHQISLSNVQKDAAQKGKNPHRAVNEDQIPDARQQDGIEHAIKGGDKAEASKLPQRRRSSKLHLQPTPHQHQAHAPGSISSKEQSGTSVPLQNGFHRNQQQRNMPIRMPSHPYQGLQRQSASLSPVAASSTGHTPMREHRNDDNQAFESRGLRFNQNASGAIQSNSSLAPQTAPDPSSDGNTFAPDNDAAEDAIGRLSASDNALSSGTEFDVNATMMHGRMPSNAPVLQVIPGGLVYRQDNQYKFYGGRSDGEFANSAPASGLPSSPSAAGTQASALTRRSDEDGNPVQGKKGVSVSRLQGSPNAFLSDNGQGLLDSSVGDPASHGVVNRAGDLNNEILGDQGLRSSVNLTVDNAPAPSVNECGSIAGQVDTNISSQPSALGSNVDFSADGLECMDPRSSVSIPGRVPGHVVSEDDNGSLRSDRQGSNGGPPRSGTASQRSTASGASTGRGGRRKSLANKGTQVSKSARSGAKGRSDNTAKAASRGQPGAAGRMSSSGKAQVNRPSGDVLAEGAQASPQEQQESAIHPFSIASAAANGPSSVANPQSPNTKFDVSHTTSITPQSSQPVVILNNGNGVVSLMGGLCDGFVGYGSMESLDVGQTDLSRGGALAGSDIVMDAGAGTPAEGIDLCSKNMGSTITNGLDISDSYKAAGLHSGYPTYDELKDLNTYCSGNPDEDNMLGMSNDLDVGGMNRMNGIGRIGEGLDLDGGGFDDDTGILGGGDPATVFDLSLDTGGGHARDS